MRLLTRENTSAVAEVEERHPRRRIRCRARSMPGNSGGPSIPMLVTGCRGPEPDHAHPPQGSRGDDARGLPATPDRPHPLPRHLRQIRIRIGRLHHARGAGPAPVGLASTGDPTFAIPASLLGVPAVSMPLFQSDGLPLGLQVLGFNERDANLFGVAARCRTPPAESRKRRLAIELEVNASARR